MPSTMEDKISSLRNTVKAKYLPEGWTVTHERDEYYNQDVMFQGVRVAIIHYDGTDTIIARHPEAVAKINSVLYNAREAEITYNSREEILHRATLRNHDILEVKKADDVLLSANRKI